MSFGRTMENMILADVLYTAGSEMLLWLQRVWSSYCRAAVLKVFKNVDVYKTLAIIIICASSETTDPDDAFTSL